LQSLSPLESVSVVIPSFNEGENLLSTVSCVLKNTRCPEFELIVVDDASTDGSVDEILYRYLRDPSVRVVRAGGVGVARAKNLGAYHARGEAVVFLDAHSYTPDGWLGDLLAPLQSRSVGLIAPALGSLAHPQGPKGYGLTWEDPSLLMCWLPARDTSPYPVPLLCGACQAARRSEFLSAGGFDAEMTRWGSEDHELSLRFWLMGYTVLVHPQVFVYHQFQDVHPYQVNWYGVLFNMLRMSLLHLRLDRVNAVLSHYKNMVDLPASLHGVLGTNVLSRRAQLEYARRRSDDWWFTMFGVWASADGRRELMSGQDTGSSSGLSTF
jgi:glycosyltransferase involved in cell wall biosynthesis